MRSALAAASLLLSSLAIPANAAPPVPFFGRHLSPLLYVTSAQSEDLGGNWDDRQVYIFRNATVLVAVLGEGFGTQLPTRAVVFSGQASPERMADLGRALANARVGYQGDCSIDPPDSILEWHFHFSWFGVRDRRNSFRATEGPGEDCPFAIEELITAVHFVVNSAASNASTTLSALD
jgi:hypothetical protein